MVLEFKTLFFPSFCISSCSQGRHLQDCVWETDQKVDPAKKMSLLFKVNFQTNQMIDHVIPWIQASILNQQQNNSIEVWVWEVTREN